MRDCSAVSGLNFQDDGRGAAAVDWDLDGDLDLWLSNRTGPRLRYLENRAGSQRNFVAFRLEGKSCNRDAIGARLVLQLPGSERIQTLRAGEGFVSQSSKWIHFGIGEGESIEEVRVHWPGGSMEALRGLQPNRRYRLVQGSGRAEEWHPPRRRVELTASNPEPPKERNAGRVLMSVRPAVPDTPLPGLRGSIAAAAGRWRSTGVDPSVGNVVPPLHPGASGLRKAPRASRGEGAFHGPALRRQTGGPQESKGDAGKPWPQVCFRSRLQGARGSAGDAPGFPHRQAPADRPSHEFPDRLQETRGCPSTRALSSAQQLLADLDLLPLEGHALRDAAAKFPGIWYSTPREIRLDRLARDFLLMGRSEIATQIIDESLASNPNNPNAYLNLGAFYSQIGEDGKAIPHYRTCIRIDPRAVKA